MDVFKINVKFFAEADSFGPEEFVPVLHSWIQGQKVPDHLLVDVANYAHVFNGPGTVLVAHEANFYVDRFGGRLGLTYSRKQPAPGGFRDRLRQAIATALQACAELEQDPRLAGRLKFRTGEIQVRLNDRLLAPNTAESWAAVRPEIEAVAKDLYRGPVTVEHAGDPRALLEARVKATSSASAVDLLSRIAAAVS